MKSHRASGVNLIAGVTFLEIIMVIAILSIIFMIGAPVSVQFYLDYQLDSEMRLFSSAIQYARNLSLINHNEADHGIYINNSNLVIFQGSSYAGRTASEDKIFPRVSAITFSGATELIFSALSGETASTTFSVTDSRRTKYIYVNPEGLVY